MNAIAAVAYTGGTGCLMVKQDLNAKSIDDLKGKKIASRPGSTIDSILKGKILPALNAKADEFEFVNIDFKDQISAIAGGSVDAFAGVEPFCALAESQKMASKLVGFEKYDILPNMLASTDKFVDANPETAKAVVKSIAEAGDMFRNEPEKVTDILYNLYSSTGYSLDKETLGRLLKTVDVQVKYVDGLDRYFANEARILSEQGRLPSADVDWSKKLRPDFNASVGG